MYYKPKYGYVYIIYNPSFKGWVKVGCALDANDRLAAFQTASPHRNFKLRWAMDTDNKLSAEEEAHAELAKHAKRKGEWFKIQPHKARKILERLKCWN
jgi:hypothetical protein